MAPETESMLPTPTITLFPAGCIQLGWRKNDCVGGGMTNVGNACYLNSTLQALFHVPAFVNWLCSDNSHLTGCTVVNGSVKDVCIICAMNKTFKATRKKRGTIIKPQLIYNRLQFISKDLVPGKQEDAHEFMCYLLKSMKKSYLACYEDFMLDSYSMETTPLDQIFGGYIRTEVTCLQCGSVYTTFQHCQDFILDIQHASTLDGALAAYFCEEYLDGDDAYWCEQCHRKVSAAKKFSLEKPPQVLCIQIKRFDIMGEKIDKHISFSLRLDLTRFLCPQSAHHGPAPLTYHLVSMVIHDGSSIHCGHYTAVAKTSVGHYYEFDDNLVQAISLSEVLGTNAYIMIYEREPEGPSMPNRSVLSAATCAVNGQKTSSSPQAPVSHKNESVVNHRQGCGSDSAICSYTCASSPPSAKGELTSSDSVAAPHCSWDKPSLGKVNPPFQHSSSKCKRPFTHKSCCPDNDVTANDLKLLEDDSKLLNSHTGNATDVESGVDNMTRRSEHVKKIKDSNEGIETILSQLESKHITVSGVEKLNSVQDSLIEEKKRNKKHKKKKKSTADVSEGSKAAKGSCELVEETSDTLGTSIAYQAQIIIHSWTGTHKPGEHCDMNEGLEHDGENDAKRKRCNRKKHKKVKHHHLRS